MADNRNNRSNDIPDGYVDINSKGRQNKNNKDNRKTNKTKTVVRNSVIIFFSVLFIIAGAGMLYYYNILSSVNVVPSGNASLPSQTLSIPSAVGSDTEDMSASSDFETQILDEELMNDSNVLNILLIGEDNRHGAQYGRTDTMILLTIDNNNKEIKLTSFMRDLWVNIPGYGMQRINVAYTVGGAPRTVSTIEANFGIDIDRYAIVDFSSFVSIIDILGGIDIELSDEEIDYINWQTWKNGQADTRYEIQASAGVVHLIGRQALWHARNRGQEGICSGSDFTRTQRQRQVLKTLMSNFKNASLTQIINIVNEVGPLVTTDLSYYEITVLVANALTYLQYDIHEHRLPTTDNYTGVTTSGGASVLAINDWTRARNELKSFVFESQEGKESKANDSGYY